jgi:hypothetical protein
MSVAAGTRRAGGGDDGRLTGAEVSDVGVASFLVAPTTSSMAPQAT